MEDKDYYILVDYRCKINSLEDKIEKLEKTPITSQTEISDTEIEFAGTNAWIEYNFNVSDDAESFYGGWKLAIEWYREKLKQL